MADKEDKILRPLDWIGIIVMGIVVVAVLGWSFSSAEGKQQAREALASTEGCESVGVLIDHKSDNDITLRGIYECDDGTDTPRMVLTPPE